MTDHKPPQLRYVGTCTELGDVYERVHDPDPSTNDGQPAPVDKPRRHWRVTKADYEAVIAKAGRDAERMAETLERHMSTITWLQGFAAKQRDALGRWRLAALAGWAAFAVAVVWH